ncbi:MAG: 3-methyl-2-oxobutanoate hydroxymethyltransferase [Bacteriovoracaceae bacterium]|nr:3-methyl-2-oxobutanoate hydroxymethyltransferase [Bacteriovoracaceae bacterium]
MKAQTTKYFRNYKLKNTGRSLHMLTCYDYQTARVLNETELDLILVGDSLGNVILGYETTIDVTLEDMIVFGAAVKRGAPDKFIVVDLPFGTYTYFEQALESAIKLFRKTNAQALKLEGAHPHHLEIVKRLSENGIPVMGHIGLTPQSIHEMGGYYMHGKDFNSKKKLIDGAKALEVAGVFALVLECVDSKLSTEITDALSIPTIGIGSGKQTDGQVLVLNDLLGMSPDKTPGFVTPLANLFSLKKTLIDKYLYETQPKSKENLENNHVH